MMVNDDERRKVAQRLRELEIGVTGTVTTTGTLARNILDAIKYGHSSAMTPYGLLADIIEPSCDRDALLKLAKHLDAEAECMVKCNDLIARRSDRSRNMAIAKDFSDIADKIREALGVTDG